MFWLSHMFSCLPPWLKILRNFYFVRNVWAKKRQSTRPDVNRELGKNYPLCIYIRGCFFFSIITYVFLLPSSLRVGLGNQLKFMWNISKVSVKFHINFDNITTNYNLISKSQKTLAKIYFKRLYTNTVFDLQNIHW